MGALHLRQAQMSEARRKLCLVWKQHYEDDKPLEPFHLPAVGADL
jgi:hypothetical protein